MTWEKIPEVEAALERLFLAVKNHSPGQPYDATGHETDVGELMWRGLLEPCASRSLADVSVAGGQMLFSLTGAGHAARRP